MSQTVPAPPSAGAPPSGSADVDPTPAQLLSSPAPQSQPTAGPVLYEDPLAKRPRPHLSLALWPVYSLVILIGALLLARSPAPLISLRASAPTDVALPMPARDLPTFHLMQSSDLVTQTLHGTPVPTGALTDTARISGTVALAPLVAGQVITRSMILDVSDRALLTNTVAVAVDGPPALAFGGGLRAGAVVTAWSGSDRLAERLLVLDVRHIDAPRAADAFTHYVIVLAVPIDLRTRIVEAAAAQTLTFTGTP